MYPVDVKSLREGSIFGMTMYGSIRNIGIVDSISNGIIKAHALRGQFQIAFASTDLPSTIDPERLSSLEKNPELLNGNWAKGIKIGYTSPLDPSHIDYIHELDRQLSGKSAASARELLDINDETLSVLLKAMNTAANEAEPELPLQFAI